MNDLDRALFWWINGWPDAQAPFWLFWSKGMGHPVVRGALILLALGLLIAPKTRKGGFAAVFAWIFANLWTDIFKAAIPFRRPMAELEGVLTRGVGLGAEMGTASAHSANMMCVAVCFCWYFRWWGSPWVAAAILVGLSRAYVGAHYPSQVLFGWTLGAMTAVIFCATLDAGVALFQKRRKRAEPQEPLPEEPA